MSTDLFAELAVKAEPRSVPERVTAFKSPAGGCYAVLTQQLRDAQHRFLLPLYERRIAGFISAMSLESLAYSLGNDDGHNAIVWRSNLGARELRPLGALCGSLSPGKQFAVMREWSKVVEAMTMPDQIPSTTVGQLVRRVCVSILAPEDALYGTGSSSQEVRP